MHSCINTDVSAIALETLCATSCPWAAPALPLIASSWPPLSRLFGTFGYGHQTENPRMKLKEAAPPCTNFGKKTW